ncbi:unnamed protein product [Parnassius apollo]|uniref:(apollo) hypothetical protein n=1 Tax=Parnassius apollo TaxID=110799 RepID=A0A8S3X528_PARAO|nr:unnamed protein product [Parnassius apollo]
MIPIELSERLSEIVANSKVLRQHTNAKSDKNEDSYTYDQSSDYEHVKTVSKDRNNKVSFNKNRRTINEPDGPENQNINVDQLAQEIKERVIKELLSKFLRLKLAKKLSDENRKIKRVGKRQKHLRERKATTKPSNIQHSIKHITIRKQKSTTITTNYGRWYVTPSQLNTDADLIVEEIPIIEETDLRPKANDSYEYYVAPEKEDNVFTSIENNADIEIESNRGKLATQKYETHQKQVEKYYSEKSKESDENKKNPENIRFDDKEEVQDTDSVETKAQEPHQVEQNTVKPIRQHFRWTSPNYYASLPTIAEQYNFDEPLPDKDRNWKNI